LFDRFFKLALLATLAGGLFVAWNIGKNGRYVYYPQNGHDLSWVIDSRTGMMFLIAPKAEGLAFVEVHPQTGERIMHYMWQRNAPTGK
jgi:hypothetical protein